MRTAVLKAALAEKLGLEFGEVERGLAGSGRVA
jgi:hypothetical protein